MNEYSEGYNDYHTDVLATECPYYNGSVEAEAWLQGWWDAWSE